MIIPLIIWWFITGAVKESDSNPSVVQNENDLFLRMMDQSGRSICDYGYQRVPELMSYSHYTSTIPESDRDLITWDKYRYIVMYLKDFDKDFHLDVSTMEGIFCNKWSIKTMEGVEEVTVEPETDQLTHQLLSDDAAK